MVLPVEEIPAQPKMLPGLGQLSLERRNRVATGMAADGLALHAGVILDLLNSERGPPNWMPNAAWLANKREQQALAYEAVTKDVFIRGRPSTPQVVEAFQTLYSDVRARGQREAFSLALRKTGAVRYIVALMDRSEQGKMRQHALDLLCALTGASDDQNYTPMIWEASSAPSLDRYLVEMLHDYPDTGGLFIINPNGVHGVQEHGILLVKQLLDSTYRYSIHANAYEAFRAEKDGNLPDVNEFPHEPVRSFAARFVAADGIQTLLALPCFHPVVADGFFCNEQDIFTVLKRLTQMGNASMTKMMEAGVIDHLFRIALRQEEKDDYYPRSRAFDIVQSMLSVSTREPYVAAAVLPYMGELIAFFKRTRKQGMDMIHAVELMEKATAFEPLLDAIVNTDGCLQTAIEHFKNIDTRCREELALLFSSLLRERPLLGAQLEPAYEHLKKMMMTRSWYEYHAYVHMLGTFWAHDSAKRDAFTKEASFVSFGNVARAFALRASSATFLPMLKGLLGKARAWRELQTVVSNHGPSPIRFRTTHSDQDSYTWDNAKVADALRDKQVLFEAGVRDDEPIAAYMLLALWQHDAASGADFDAKWWDAVADEVREKYQSSVVHAPLMMAQAKQLKEHLLAPGGPLYKVAEASYEENDAKRMRTGSALAGHLRDLSSAVVKSTSA
jgi:hypothetical protein